MGQKNGIFKLIVTAWISVCYVAINLFIISYNKSFILVIPVEFCWLRWSWLRFDYNLTTVFSIIFSPLTFYFSWQEYLFFIWYTCISRIFNPRLACTYFRKILVVACISYFRRGDNAESNVYYFYSAFLLTSISAISAET